MSLNNQWKYIQHEFTLDHEKLKCVKPYSKVLKFYFKLAQKTVAGNAMKALVKLKGLLYESGMNPLTSVTLFDQLVKPIVSYGSDLADLVTLSNRQKFLESMEKPFVRNLDQRLP